MIGKEIKNKAGEEKEVRKIANFLEDIYVRDPDDENDAAIVNNCLLSEQYIIVCDRSNCTVKLVDTKCREVVDSRPTYNPPNAVTKINDTEIAVVQPTDEYENSIIQFLFLTRSNRLVFKKRKIFTEMYCSDIFYIPDGRLIISMSFEDNGKVQILNMNGEILTNIEMMDKHSCSWFRRPNYITLNRGANRAYVSDWYNDSITEIDLYYQDAKILPICAWHPGGITTDNDGCIYVCEIGDNSVYVFHPDEQWMHALLDGVSGKLQLQCLCYSDTEKKLYVAQGWNVIKVYKLAEAK